MIVTVTGTLADTFAEEMAGRIPDEAVLFWDWWPDSSAGVCTTNGTDGGAAGPVL